MGDGGWGRMWASWWLVSTETSVCSPDRQLIPTWALPPSSLSSLPSPDMCASWHISDSPPPSAPVATVLACLSCAPGVDSCTACLIREWLE